MHNLSTNRCRNRILEQIDPFKMINWIWYCFEIENIFKITAINILLNGTDFKKDNEMKVGVKHALQLDKDGHFSQN